MLLLVSNLLFSQATNTNLTKCFSEAQVSEIFKGLKQGEYLKTWRENAEKTMKLGDDLISEQKNTITKQGQIINTKDEIITNNQNIYNQDKEIFAAKNEQLQSILDLNKKIAKQDGRKKFWSGIKIGGFSVTVIGVAALLLLK